MIRGFFYKFNRSFKNLQNVIFHVKLLAPTLMETRSYVVEQQFGPELVAIEVEIGFMKTRLKQKK